MTDLDSLFRDAARAAVGFDTLFSSLESAGRAAADGYPPYNVERVGEDGYRVTLAVAGFRLDELEVVAERGKLTVKGKPDAAAEPKGAAFLHRGIARRAFTRAFMLAEHIEVTGASLEHGLLTVSLTKLVPEKDRPRGIAIQAAPASAPAALPPAA